MISVSGLTKHFGQRLAVAALELQIPRGSIYGLLGHNGAGKSTVIGMLLGQVFPDAGTITINGHDVLTNRREALAEVGAVYERPAFYDYLSGERNLRIYGEYTAPTDATRLAEVVAMVGLTTRIRDRVATYSHGMRQRLALAQALLPHPSLLILDEPTEGLDPEGIVETRNLILKLNREWDITVVASSHQLSEMEQICTHLAILREGHLMFAGEWRPAAGRSQECIVKVDRQTEGKRALAAAGLVTWSDQPTLARLHNGVSIAQVAKWLVGAGFAIEELSPIPMTLEAFYLETSRRADVSKGP